MAVKQYTHSRIVTNIVDNSIVDEQVTVPVEFVLFQPYFSEEGEDGHVIQWEKTTDFKNKNGKPNIAKYGQHAYNALQWLKGGGKVLGLRLTATDSKPSFGVLNIRTKPVTVTIPDTGDTGGSSTLSVSALKISPTFTKIPDALLTTGTLALPETLLLKQLSNALASSEDVPTTEGWTNHFLTVFKMTGRGKYGNNYGVYLQLDQTREEDLDDARRYFYAIFKREATGNTTQSVSQVSISFDSSAVDPSGTVSEFIDTAIKTDSYRKEFTGISTYTNDTVYSDLVNLFTAYTGKVMSVADPSVVVVPEENPRMIDFLTLVDRKGQSYKRFAPADENDEEEFEQSGSTPDTNFANIAYLMSGTDGNIDIDNYTIGSGSQYPTKAAAEAAIAEIKNGLIEDAYAGKIDANILSPYKYQISAVVDANNSPDAKAEMIYLCRERKDIVAYIDCGFVASVEAAINYKNAQLAGFTDWNASVWPQSGVAYDADNLRNIDVTIGFEIAYKLPYLRLNYGPNRLMAGTTKGAIQTMDSLNWYPDEDQKSELLANQMNYVEEVRLNQYAIMSTRTMYARRLSYLAVIRNVHCMCEAVWVGRQILTDLRFEEDPKVAMTKAKEQITRNLSYLITNGPVERLTVTTSQSIQEAYENAASATIEMKFTDFIHTWYFNIVAAR